MGIQILRNEAVVTQGCQQAGAHWLDSSGSNHKHALGGQERVGWPGLCCHGDGGWRTHSRDHPAWIFSAQRKEEGRRKENPSRFSSPTVLLSVSLSQPAQSFHGANWPMPAVDERTANLAASREGDKK